MFKFKSRLSLVMAAAFIFALAINITTPAVKAIEAEPEQEPERIVDPQTREVISMREEYKQAYLRDDGKVEVHAYSVPVNYLNADGEYTPIDNTIIEDTASESGFRYTNASNDVKVYFNDSTSSAYTAKVAFNSSSISVKPTVASTVTAQIVTENTDYAYDTGAGNLFANETLLYRNMYANADYALTTTNLGMRQNIILKNANAADSYLFTLKLDHVSVADMSIRTPEDGNIAFVNRMNEVLFMLINPHAKDADGESVGTSMNIVSTDTDNNTITVRIALDGEYLEGNRYAYPITVTNTYYTDKNVGTRSTLMCPYDLYVIPNSIYVNNPIVSNTDRLALNAAGTYKMYIKFDPTWQSVTSADLCLTVESNSSTENADRIYAWGLLNYWTKQTLATVYPNQTTVNSHVSATGGGVYTIEVENIINNQISITGEDYGYRIKYVPSGTNPSGYTYFYACEYGNPLLAPYLMYTI